MADEAGPVEDGGAEEMMDVRSLKKVLSENGVSTETFGVKGAERHAALWTRYLQLRQALEDAERHEREEAHARAERAEEEEEERRQRLLMRQQQEGSAALYVQPAWRQGVSLAELKALLRTHGVENTATPGVSGEARKDSLLQRLYDHVVVEADRTGTPVDREVAEIFGLHILGPEGGVPRAEDYTSSTEAAAPESGSESQLQEEDGQGRGQEQEDPRAYVFSEMKRHALEEQAQEERKRQQEEQDGGRQVSPVHPSQVRRKDVDLTTDLSRLPSVIFIRNGHRVGMEQLQEDIAMARGLLACMRTERHEAIERRIRASLGESKQDGQNKEEEGGGDNLVAFLYDERTHLEDVRLELERVKDEAQHAESAASELVHAGRSMPTATLCRLLEKQIGRAETRIAELEEEIQVAEETDELYGTEPEMGARRVLELLENQVLKEHKTVQAEREAERQQLLQQKQEQEQDQLHHPNELATSPIIDTAVAPPSSDRQSKSRDKTKGQRPRKKKDRHNDGDGEHGNEEEEEDDEPVFLRTSPEKVAAGRSPTRRSWQHPSIGYVRGPAPPSEANQNAGAGAGLDPSPLRPSGAPPSLPNKRHRPPPTTLGPGPASGAGAVAGPGLSDSVLDTWLDGYAGNASNGDENGRQQTQDQRQPRGLRGGDGGDVDDGDEDGDEFGGDGDDDDGSVDPVCKEWTQQARQAERDGDIVTAEEAYENALEADPMDATMLCNFALFLHRRRREFDRAETLYRRALQVRGETPRASRIRLNLANFLQRVRGQTDAAEAMLRDAMRIDPNNASVLVALARMLDSVRGEVEEAEELFRRALTADAQNTYNLCAFAKFLRRERRMDEAENMYRAALKSDPNSAQAICNYASFLAKVRHDHDTAQTLFVRGLQMHPDHRMMKRNYGIFLKRKVQRERAREFAASQPRPAAPPPPTLSEPGAADNDELNSKVLNATTTYTTLDTEDPTREQKQLPRK